MKRLVLSLRTNPARGALVLLIVLGLGGLSACSATSTGNSGSAGLSTNSANTGNTGAATNTSNTGNTGNAGSTGSGDFCSTHTCIANFANGTGYIVQCADGEWSHSGGRPGACSDHGGETGNTPGDAGTTGSTGNTGATSSTNTGNTGNTGSGGFCSSHTCIANFANGTGYIVQCADGEWSHSGGRSGACSDHGGETGNTPGSTVNTGNTGNTGSNTPGTATFAPGDHNPKDGHAPDCDTTMAIGPHSDCSVAEQVANDVAANKVTVSSDFTFTDTVTDNANYPQEQHGDTITFNCHAPDGPGGYYACISAGDAQDWFDFSGQQ